MTEETKELNGQPAPVDEKKEEVKNPDASQEKDNQEIDYKAELEKAIQEAEKRNKRLEQAEYKIVELKKKNKKEEDDELEFDEFGEPIEKPKEDIRSIIKEELNSFKRDMSSSIIDEEISKITNNPDEIALIKHHYENSINQSGFDKQSIQNDIQKAYALANSQKILRNNRELVEALKAKKTVSGGTGGSSAGPAIKESGYPEELSEQDISFLKAQGITPEKYNQLNNK
jgi:ABC-type antimicrobial peptide transport system permease subunit